MFSTKYFTLLIITCCFLSQDMYAQSGEGEHVGIKTTFNPVPASPNVASFEKYGNLPVNYNTGIPQIGIPIYDITMNGFTWPLRLSYHASGFKSDDIASRNGLGWSLQGSGTISSAPSEGVNLEIKRHLDLSYTSSGSTECIPSNHLDINLADQIMSGLINTSGGNNTMLSTATINGKIFGGTTVPVSDVIMGPENGIFVMYDDGGNKFEFGIQGSNHRTSMCDGIGSVSPNRTAYLTRIVTIKGETISFSYESEDYTYRLPDSHIRKIINANQLARCYLDLNPEDYYCQNVYYAQEKRLKKIEATNGTLVYFQYSGRLDVPGSAKVDRVDIWYKTGIDSNLIKRTDFRYSYFGQGTDQYALQLRLDEVVIKGGNTDSLSNYKFFYNNAQLPYKLDAPISFVFNSLTQASYNISKAGILEKMQYPTGGYTTFDYQVLPGYGVLRIKEIKDFDRDNNVSGYRYYRYNDNQGNEYTPPDYISGSFLEYETTYFFGVRSANGAPIDYMNYLPCQQPYDYLVDCNRTIWKNSPIRHTLEDYMDLSPRYPYVVELFGGNGENGKIEYDYDVPVKNRNMPDAILLTTDYLVEKKVFKKLDNGQYELVNKTKNQYETSSCNDTLFATSEHPKEIRSWMKKIFMTRPKLILPCGGGELGGNYCFSPEYLQLDARITNVPVYLKKTIEETYAATGKITTEQSFYYDELRLVKPTRVEVTKSNGEQYRIESRYPYYFSGNAVYEAMVAKNMVSPVVEEIKKNITTNQELSHTKANFDFWQGNAFIDVGSVYQSFKGNTLEPETIINKYDTHGNILQLTDKSGIIKSFSWGYNSNHLVAQTINASIDQIAYTSFEANDWGGWTMNPGSTIFDNGDLLTGKKVFSGVVLKTVPTGNYTVGVWGTANTWVNSQLLTQPTKIKGQWRYYEIKLNNVSAIEVAGNTIDEVRLYPQGAQMTTYTYDPLIGITSQCDALNRITYYEYDGFGRLKLIRDENKNVLKIFDYQYQKNYNQ